MTPAELLGAAALLAIAVVYCSWMAYGAYEMMQWEPDDPRWDDVAEATDDPFDPPLI